MEGDEKKKKAPEWEDDRTCRYIQLRNDVALLERLQNHMQCGLASFNTRYKSPTVIYQKSTNATLLQH
jgi:hypothetical protein